MKISVITLSASVAFIAAGCSTVYEGKYQYNEGWRTGTVEALNVDAITDRILVDCRKKVSARELAGAKFAYVKHSVIGTHTRKIVALADQDTPLQVGDKVYLRMNDCTQRLVRATAMPSKPG